MPVVAYVGQLFATISTGSYVIERMFVIPGLGNSYVESIENQDYTMVFGLTIFYSIILVSVLTIVDILYKVIDPRVRLTKKN
jgi:ABC-type dipeptide/oligopeptide/nickel transport system permease component